MELIGIIITVILVQSGFAYYQYRKIVKHYSTEKQARLLYLESVRKAQQLIDQYDNDHDLKLTIKNLGKTVNEIKSERTKPKFAGIEGFAMTSSGSHSWAFADMCHLPSLTTIHAYDDAGYENGSIVSPYVKYDI